VIDGRQLEVDTLESVSIEHAGIRGRGPHPIDVRGWLTMEEEQQA
jgi:hypothetical protein